MDCRTHLTNCLENNKVPEWKTTGRTMLTQKDKSKGNISSNYTPITCLPLVCKLLTGILADEIYENLEESCELPEEQKGCRRKCQGTEGLLFIDKMILREVKSRKKNLAVAWIDFRKSL